jgi:hypothetical protein
MGAGRSKCWGTRQGQTYPEYEAEKFRRAFHVREPAFIATVLRCLSKTQSCAMPFLLQRDWLYFWTGQALSPLIRPLHAHACNVSKAAVCNIIHEVVFILCKEFVPSMIAFPEGDDLMRVMNEITGPCHQE